MRSFRGLTMGLLSGISFGLIPLFCLPLLDAGMPYISVLFFRFVIASAALAVVIVCRGGTLNITRSEAVSILPLGAMYAVSSIFLLWGYTYIAASIATPIHFLYPVIVASVMGSFFGERITFRTLFAVAMALAGVFVLSMDKPGGGYVSLWGITIVVISAIAYALYIVAVRHSKASNIDPLKLAFYVMLIACAIIYVWALISNGGVGVIASWWNFLLLLGLAIVPTVVSNLALMDAVRLIGSTSSAILGAMEPLTAVAIGTLIFGEPFTGDLLGGVILIIAAVTIVILGGRMKRAWDKMTRKFSTFER